MTPAAAVEDEARRAAVTIVRVLREGGHTAYLAGGCVRDTLLRLAPQDYDVATDARPDRVRQLFRNSRYVGEAFGVVLVRLMRQEVEVATFRSEWGYEDGRHPTRVEFSDARHDALRRDFTINGLFEDPLLDAADPAERVIDYVGGRDDLRARLVRAIGDPGERFGEDYLRMLRAVRFSARFGFAIEEQTARAIRNHARYLGQISRERIGQEVQAMLAPPRAAPQRAQAARLVQELHLDGATLNEAHADAPTAVLAALADAAAYPTALAAWLLDRHLPAWLARSGAATPGQAHADAAAAAEAVESFDAREGEAVQKRWRRALALSNEHRDAAWAALQLLPRALRWPQEGVAARKRLLATAAWPEAHALTRALRRVLPPAAAVAEQIDRDAPPLIAEGVAPPPWVSGDDLIAMGLTPGPRFKRLLDAAYDAQLEGRCDSREACLEWLRERVGEEHRP